MAESDWAASRRALDACVSCALGRCCCVCGPHSESQALGRRFSRVTCRLLASDDLASFIRKVGLIQTCGVRGFMLPPGNLQCRLLPLSHPGPAWILGRSLRTLTSPVRSSVGSVSPETAGVVSGVRASSALVFSPTPSGMGGLVHAVAFQGDLTC